MIQRAFGDRSGLSVCPVSIGAMRLPQDVDEAVKLIRHAIDSGMRYIDTSRGYGESEWLLGKALTDGYRRKVILSTKWSPWVTKIRPTDDTSAACTRRRLEESMRRLDVDHLDFYQLWNIDSREHYDQAVAKGGMLEGILKAKEEGLVGHIGFTTHDTVENLLAYIPEAAWCEAILFTHNLLGRKYAPAIEAAHARGIATIVMNPVAGGGLAEPSPVLLPLAHEVGATSVPDLAIRYVLSNPSVTTILCGMSKPSDVDDTIASWKAGQFSPAQLARIDRFLDERNPDRSGFCTGCKYCMPCPKGIDIPGVMSCVYDDRGWGLKANAKMRYSWIRAPKADACVACGQCEAKCTQKLKISEHMAYAAKEFAKDKK